MDSTKKSNFPKKKCGVLGATGAVGQRFMLLLHQHPHFELHAIGASSRSTGKKYKDAALWKQTIALPRDIQELAVQACEPEAFRDCDFIFSGLGSDEAQEIGVLHSNANLSFCEANESIVEMAFLKANLRVFSNAKNYRQNPLVPLVVPTVNLSHFQVIPHQQKYYNLDKGFLVCNSNCAVIGIVIPFGALESAIGPIDTVSVVTSQALSGAGYPGVSAMDIKDSVVPYISGEEEKLEPEARKILGGVNKENMAFIERSDMRISATCTRVDVTDGHMAFVSLKFAKRPPPSAEQVKQAMRDYISEAQKLGCPSAPEKAITVMEQPDRPQPRLDRDADRGYSVSVGRVRKDPSGIFDIQFAALSHNTIIGAAGSSILNAEAAVLKGLA